ncbi:regulatory protein RecX, partial [Chloroflexota bacterium]
MGVITSIRYSRGRVKRARVFLDGRFAFSVATETASNLELAVGEELPPERVARVNDADGFYRCLAAAKHFLSYRPRSEAETRARLKIHTFNPADIEKAVTLLKNEGHLNDAAFASFWQENRQAFSPRGRSLTRTELLKKGVAPAIIDTVTSGMDDHEAALRAAEKKAQQLRGADYNTFRRKLAKAASLRWPSFLS